MPPIASELMRWGELREVPTAGFAVSLDHLVCARENRGRHFDAKHLGGLEVDH